MVLKEQLYQKPSQANSIEKLYLKGFSDFKPSARSVLFSDASEKAKNVSIFQ